MAQLKAVLKSLDGVEDAVQEFYNEGDDGRFYLKVDGVDDMPAVVGLKNKNRELLDEKKTLKQTLDGFGDLTPDDIEELREKAQAGSSEDVEAVREELEAKLQQARTKAQEEIQKAKEQAEAEQAAARTYFEDSEITRAITEAKGVPDLLAHKVRQHIKTERGEDGKFRLQVVGEDGQPRIKDSQGTPYGLGDLVSELKEDPKFGRAFEPSGNSGSGASPSQGGGDGRSGIVRMKDGIVRADPSKVSSGELRVVNE